MHGRIGGAPNNTSLKKQIIQEQVQLAVIKLINNNKIYFFKGAQVFINSLSSLLDTSSMGSNNMINNKQNLLFKRCSSFNKLHVKISWVIIKVADYSPILKETSQVLTTDVEIETSRGVNKTSLDQTVKDTSAKW